ncbi:MAG: hypothetical protein LC791_10905 [Acidobacteria bacterium]|nr:hypothetical protein [Acidobacteriota bacterium]
MLTLRAQLDDWRGLLRRHVPQARQILKKLFPEPLRLGPDPYGFALQGYARLDKIVQGMASANRVASLAGFDQDRTAFAGWFPLPLR